MKTWDAVYQMWKTDDGQIHSQHMGLLIRCKDCQYWMKNPYKESTVFGLCFKHKDIAIATDETDWCSWAERKEE